MSDDAVANDVLDGIAIVGMAGRFPGARNIDDLWRNLRAGVESITTFDDDALRAAGVPDALIADPNYVKRWGCIEDADCFDAGFFSVSRRDAERMDPQHRLFLEHAWAALEHAGHAASRRRQRVGIYGGIGFNHYLVHNLAPEIDRESAAAFYRLYFGNDKDFVCTRVAHALDLNGPAMTVQTACSTSLVAVCTAALHLLTHQCDLALAGGASVRVPLVAGYPYEEGGTSSPDGVCRSFDAAARGAVWGSGVAVLALRRLEDALRDGDHVYAVIKGFALNNDGANKAGFTAPGVDGQVDVIRRALAMAGFDASTVGYVEAHGTATQLGDPIEVEALTQAFRAEGARGSAGCALGSVKTNLGHLDAAAGATGLIKAALAVHAGEIPASLHFERPNPHIDFASSPFFVNAALRAWPDSGGLRRAGVSSFGIGGTNAHVVIEQAPPRPASDTARDWVLLPVSAKSRDALDRAASALVEWLGAHRDVNLADVAYSLAVGREGFAHRRFVVCKSVRDAEALLAGSPAAMIDGDPAAADRRQLLEAVGRRWASGADVAWSELFAGERRHRVPLPTYPFERERHWVEAQSSAPHRLHAIAWDVAERPPAPKVPPIVRIWREGGDVMAITTSALAELQRLLADGRERDVVWVTERAQAVASGEAPRPELAALWGLARSFALEHPPIRMTLVDVDEMPPPAEIPVGGGGVWALRSSRLLRPRLTPLSAEGVWKPSPDEGAVLITGGLGALGLHLAEHLVHRHGVRTLVLLGRHAPGGKARACVAALEAKGATVDLVEADVCQREVVARVVASRRLRGVVHAAGVLDDGIVERLTPDRLATVLAPKVLGARWLDELTRDRHLEFFVLFSSVSALGAAGQASYAAANAYLHALAERRRQAGLPAVSIGWGPWSGGGMSERVPASRRVLRPMAPERALTLFDEALAQPRAVVYALDALPAASPPSPPSPTPRATGARSNLPDVLGLLRSEVGRLLGIEPEAVPPDQSLVQLGMDSLMGVELRSGLSKALGMNVPGSLLVDEPHIERIAASLRAMLPLEGEHRPDAPLGVTRLHPEPPFPPLFLVGGAVGADELYLRTLANALGPSQPSYALHYPGMVETEEPLDDVDALADHLVSLVRRFQPRGPLAIAGHSLGGLVAYEMAVRLSRAGRSVVEVVLLDAPLFTGQDPAIVRRAALWRNASLRDYVASLRQLGWLTPEIDRVFDKSAGSPMWPLLERMWRANVNAMMRYRPSEYHGEATFITPAGEDQGLAVCIEEWSRVCPALKVARSSGNHVSMVVEPHVQRTARIIQGLFGASDLDD